MPSGPEWFIVLAVVLVIFGGSQLPKLARNLGKAQKEFKDGLSEAQTGGRGDRRQRCRLSGRGARRDQGRQGRTGREARLLIGRRSAARHREHDAVSGSGAALVRCTHPTPRGRCGCSRAYSRQGSLTGHPAQIFRALSTPTPSLREERGRGVQTTVPCRHPRRRRVVREGRPPFALSLGFAIASCSIAASGSRLRVLSPTSARHVLTSASVKRFPEAVDRRAASATA